MYSLQGYGAMVADPVRTEAYIEALERHITPGSVVLDIGAGFGFFSVVAARLGAGRVIAVEPDDSISLGPAIARANGVEDRIEFVQQRSTDFTLEGGADVIFSDLRGSLPLHEHHIAAIADARQRLLRPGGVMIPQRDVLRVALVEAPEPYGRAVGVWHQAPHGVDLSPAAGGAMSPFGMTARPDQLLDEPASWDELDYHTRTDPNAAGSVCLVGSRAGTAHGLLTWFEAHLDDLTTFETGPGDWQVYGNKFLPFPDPLELLAGDEVDVDLDARLVGDRYVWRWSATRRSGGETTRTSGSYLGTARLAPAQVARRTLDHVPELNEEGRRVRAVLQAADGTRTTAEIVERLMASDDDLFDDERAARAFATEATVIYSE